MELQFDTRNHRSQEVRIGRDEEQIASFNKSGLFVQNLAGMFDGAEYEMKLPVPWNGFRYQLRRAGIEVASAKKQRRMHAFDPDRPNVRHQAVEFDLDVGGRPYRLTQEDQHALSRLLRSGDTECGRYALRDFDAQKGGPWQGDLEVPDDWPVPLAAFCAWIARDARPST